MSREQRYRFLNRTAIVLGFTALAILGAEAAIAVSKNQLVVGFNYWNAPLFSVTQLILAVTLAVFLTRYAIKHWNDKSGRVPRDD